MFQRKWSTVDEMDGNFCEKYFIEGFLADLKHESTIPVRNITRTAKMQNAYKILIGNPE
jgi:hypothetical protein